MTTTTAAVGVTIGLHRVGAVIREIKGWATKSDALARLAVLREVGLNRDECVTLNRAETHLTRFWVIARPDPLGEMTWLMTGDGQWVRGRLYDASPCFCASPCRRGHAAPWVSAPTADGALIPATVTHDYRYSAGRIGLSDGHGNALTSDAGFDGRRVELTAWDAHAWCIACSWSTHADHEDSARAAARWHRVNPEQYPTHATPRRPLATVAA